METPTGDANFSSPRVSKAGGVQCAGLGRGGLALMLGHGRRGCEKVNEGLKVVDELGEQVLKAHFICLNFLEVLDHCGSPDVLYCGATCGM